jgi:hypothetical protein
MRQQSLPVVALEHDPVAQWIERQIADLQVAGSTPVGIVYIHRQHHRTRDVDGEFWLHIGAVVVNAVLDTILKRWTRRNAQPFRQWVVWPVQSQSTHVPTPHPGSDLCEAPIHNAA